MAVHKKFIDKSAWASPSVFLETEELPFLLYYLMCSFSERYDSMFAPKLFEDWDVSHRPTETAALKNIYLQARQYEYLKFKEEELNANKDNQSKRPYRKRQRRYNSKDRERG